MSAALHCKISLFESFETSILLRGGTGLLVGGLIRGILSFFFRIGKGSVLAVAQVHALC